MGIYCTHHECIHTRLHLMLPLVHAVCVLCLHIDGRGDWNTRGCMLVNETEDNVTCQCDHLTSFSMLLVSQCCRQ